MGVRQRLMSRITEFERPNPFTDEMVRGPFKKMKHVHEFVPLSSGTLMLDTFMFESRFGVLGRLFDRLLLTGYVKGLLVERNAYLKRVAESHKQLT